MKRLNDYTFADIYQYYRKNSRTSFRLESFGAVNEVIKKSFPISIAKQDRYC